MRETRTERDLTEALAALERFAPDPEDVLRAVRDQPRRPASWRRRDRLILSAVAAAAATALAIALLPGTVRRPAPSGLPAATSVAQAMLTAFEGASGDVEYETQTGYTHGAIVDVYRTWAWPAQPVAGQRQLERTLFSSESPASPVVKLTEDRGVSLVTPPSGVGMTRGQITMVCFLGSGQTGCGWGNKNTLPGTWSRFTAEVGASTDVGAGGLFNPAVLARGIAGGAWRVVARTRLEGRPAIELSETGRGTDIIEPLPVLLWVDAQTYLPIHMVVEGGSNGTTVEDFSFLPPTAANVALLRVPIPAGYPRR